MTGIGALLAGVGLIVAIVVVLALVLLAGRGGPRLPLVARAVAGVVAIATVVVAVATALPLAIGAPATVSVPLQPLRPQAPHGVELTPPVATIVGGGIDHATLQLTGLSIPTRILLIAAIVLQAATVVLLALIVLRLAGGVTGSDPFRVGGRAILACAVVVVVGGIAWSVLGDIGSWRAAQEALAVPGWHSSFAPLNEAAAGTADSREALARFGWPEPAEFAIGIPLWPLGAGLALALLAAAFRAGERLRRDTEGLV